jgi:hypothetical protein
MIDSRMTGKILIFGLIFSVLLMALLSISRKNRHNDYVIKTANEEFIVDNYTVSDDEQCVYFTYDGDEKTICGNYEIIK